MSTRSLFTSESLRALSVTSAGETWSSEATSGEPLEWDSRMVQQRPTSVSVAHLPSSASWWAEPETGCSASLSPRQLVRPARWSWREQVELAPASWKLRFSSPTSWETRRKWGLGCPHTASSSPCSLSELWGGRAASANQLPDQTSGSSSSGDFYGFKVWIREKVEQLKHFKSGRSLYSLINKMFSTVQRLIFSLSLYR